MGVYVFFFAIPLIIMYIGIHNGDIKMIKSGFSLFLYMYAAFIGSSIKEMKNLKINKKNLGIVTGMFIATVIIIVLGYRLDIQVLATVFSLIMGCLAIFLLLRSPKNTDIKESE